MNKQRKGRKWWWIIVILLLVGGGWGIYRWQHPVLHPTSVQTFPRNCWIFFSAGGVGYPATVGEDQGVRQSRRWLDAHGRPMGQAVHIYPPAELLISPHRKIGARTFPIPTGSGLVETTTPAGVSSRRHNPLLSTCQILLSVDDAGGYCTSQWNYFTPQGERIPLPRQYSVACDYVSTDPRYLVLKGYDWHRLNLYDLKARKLIAGPKVPGINTYSMGVVFAAGDRFLAVPAQGKAIVFTQRGDLLKTFGGINTIWRWGEDGTAWINEKHPRVICWRAGSCRLQPFPAMPPADSSVDAMTCPGMSIWYRVPFMNTAVSHGSVAAWKDGELTAFTRPLPKSRLRTYAMAQLKHFFPKAMPDDYRDVVLYRRNRLLGTYRLPLNRPSNITLMISSIRTPLTGMSEHLAFSGDGKYLAWTLRDADKLRVTVFAVK